MILAGPPRLVSGVTVLLVLMLMAYTSMSLWGGTVESRLKAQTETKKAKTLDFSIPLPFKPGIPKPPGENYSMAIVIPETYNEDARWAVNEVSKFADVYVYEVNNVFADFKVPKNKGNEGMTYLTYIIDYYDHLPEIVLFFHAHRTTWHNNEAMSFDSLETVKRLRPERVIRHGYMNTRCAHNPGCPDWIHLDRPAVDLDYVGKPEEIWFRSSTWNELHPGAPIPATIAQPCCAQFAVSRERIRQIPKERFEHYRDWLLNTKLRDRISGRVMEYTWQYIFTGQTQLCPAENTCLCDGFGVCFGGASKLAEWQEKVKRRDELRGAKMHAHYSDPGRAEMVDELKKLEKEVNDLVIEAKKRGEDPTNREREMETLDDDQFRKFLPEHIPPNWLAYPIEPDDG